MIGDRIKKARLALGYSAEQVAAHLGVSPATIYRYENGDIAKLPSKHIKPLAEFLCVSPSYLMDWSDDNPPRKMDLHLFNSEEDDRLSQFLSSYNSLSAAGKDYVQQQLKVAQVMFSEHASDFNKEE